MWNGIMSCKKEWCSKHSLNWQWIKLTCCPANSVCGYWDNITQSFLNALSVFILDKEGIGIQLCNLLIGTALDKACRVRVQTKTEIKVLTKVHEIKMLRGLNTEQTFCSIWFDLLMLLTNGNNATQWYVWSTFLPSSANKKFTGTSL